ncbi:MAG: PQQ-binding-like beta-propeller repeat protein [Thermoguttaceae bacterium]
MTNEDSPRPDPQDTSNAALLDPRLVGVKILPNWLLVFLVALGIIVAIIRGTDVLNDHATANIATWLLTFIAIVTCSVWFLFRSPYPRRVRVVAGVCCLVALGLFFALFRVDHVSGELVPSFAFRYAPKPDRQIGHPNADRRAVRPASPIDLRTTGADDFPQFLGPDRTTSYDRVRPARDWTAKSPRLLWRHEIGAGWSAFSVVHGYAVTMEQWEDLEMVTCYEVKTGKLEWAYPTAARYETTVAGVGPRSTPTIDDGMVYALGAKGALLCLDGATGECRWKKDLLQVYGIAVEEEAAQITYGRSNSPLIVDDLVIIPAGGPKDGRHVSLAAFDKRQGTLVWEAGDQQVSYSSPALVTLAGKRQILIVNEATVSGHDPKTGRVLWEHPWPAHTGSRPNVSQAMLVPPDRVLLSNGYGLGGSVVRLDPKEDGTFAVNVVWKSTKVLRTKFTNVVIRGGCAYGLSDGILECVDLADGRSLWRDGRYRHGQILGVGDTILVLSETGEVVLVEASPERGNRVFGRFQAIDGMTWNNIALYGPYLLVRNAQEAACYELPVEEHD